MIDEEIIITSEKKSYAMVCAANMNRSMAAHCALLEKGIKRFIVRRGVVGENSRLDERRSECIYVWKSVVCRREERFDLFGRKTLYRQKGLIDMLERNMRVKEKPERWQDNSDEKEFDVVVCFEERVFDLVLADMREKNAKGTPCLVINLDVRDSHEDAVNAAPMALKLCEMIEKCEDWECEIDEIIDQFEEEVGIKPLYSVCYY